jgi:hypothetical protein
MKLNRLIPLTLTLAMLSASPAQAATSGFLLDFEHNWTFGTDVANYYNGSTSNHIDPKLQNSAIGPNYGVTFTSTVDSGMLALSNNDGLGGLPNGDYYANAPSMLGTAFAFGPTVFMNVAAGVDTSLSFFYSSPNAINGALKAYSGLNGTGSLLGSFDITANNSGLYDTWNSATFNFAGTAQSFDFSASGLVAFDNIAAVPEPESYALFLAGLGMMGFVARRKNK